MNDAKKKIIENNAAISELLAANEALYDSLEDDEVLDKEQHITIPKGCISRVKVLTEKYHLDSIIQDEHVRKNLCYLIEYLQLDNYVFNRFNIFASVRTMLLKNATIVYASILETLILSAANSIRNNCEGCKTRSKCSNNFNGQTADRMKKALPKLAEMGIITVDENTVRQVIELYDARNNIHVFKTEGNEFLNDDYTEQQCDLAESLVERISEDLFLHAVPRYTQKSCEYTDAT